MDRRRMYNEKIKQINHACQLFFDKIELANGWKKFRIKSKYFDIKCNEKIFTSDSLLHIGVNFKKIINIYRYSDITVRLDLLEVQKFADKNTYLVLDLFIFYLLYNCPNIKFRIYININLKNIIHNGLKGTALYRVAIKSEDNIINRKEYIENYLKSYIDIKHYRKIYTENELDDTLASNIYTNTNIMLNPYFDEVWADEVAEAISEIVCNACSHNKGMILLDIDICDQVGSFDLEDNSNYKALNVSVLNIGDRLIYDKLMENVKQKKYDEEDKVYKNIYKAYNNHKDFFDDYYTENDFFIITAFQKRVSSRSFVSGQHGTGLTKLLQNITGKTEENFSYVISGRNGIFFKNEFLNVSTEGTVGFNLNNDYINERPDDKVISRCPIFIPGTIYQLHLVWRDHNE